MKFYDCNYHIFTWLQQYLRCLVYSCIPNAYKNNEVLKITLRWNKPVLQSNKILQIPKNIINYNKRNFCCKLFGIYQEIKRISFEIIILNMHHHSRFSHLHDFHVTLCHCLTGVEIIRYRVRPKVKFHHKNHLIFQFLINTSRFKALNNDLRNRFWSDVVIKSCIPFFRQWADHDELQLNTNVLLLCNSMKMIDKLLGVSFSNLIFHIIFVIIIDC